MPATRLIDIPRNDVAACVAYYQERGQIRADEARVMLKLQDDPTELREVMKDWTQVA